MNKKIFLFLYVIATIYTAQCFGSEYDVEQRALNKAVTDALRGGKQSSDFSLVQTSLELVSRKWLNAEFIQQKIKPLVPINSEGKGCIIFCQNEKCIENGSAKSVLIKKFDLSRQCWTDVSDLKFLDDILLTIYYVPNGVDLSLGYYRDQITYLMSERNPLVICFENDIAPETVLFINATIKNTLESCVCNKQPNPTNPRVKDDDPDYGTTLGIENQWRYNIQNFREKVIVTVVVVLAGVFGSLYKMRR